MKSHILEFRIERKDIIEESLNSFLKLVDMHSVINSIYINKKGEIRTIYTIFYKEISV